MGSLNIHQNAKTSCLLFSVTVIGFDLEVAQMPFTTGHAHHQSRKHKFGHFVAESQGQAPATLSKIPGRFASTASALQLPVSLSIPDPSAAPLPPRTPAACDAASACDVRSSQREKEQRQLWTYPDKNFVKMSEQRRTPKPNPSKTEDIGHGYWDEKLLAEQIETLTSKVCPGCGKAAGNQGIYGARKRGPSK
jgi:hypothetical protein